MITEHLLDWPIYSLYKLSRKIKLKFQFKLAIGLNQCLLRVFPLDGIEFGFNRFIMCLHNKMFTQMATYF